MGSKRVLKGMGPKRACKGMGPKRVPKGMGPLKGRDPKGPIKGLLTDLRLQDAGLVGDVASLASSHRLQILVLGRNPQIRGNLADLAGLTALHYPLFDNGLQARNVFKRTNARLGGLYII